MGIFKETVKSVSHSEEICKLCKTKLLKMVMEEQHATHQKQLFCFKCDANVFEENVNMM
jgi:superfamily II helicase